MIYIFYTIFTPWPGPYCYLIINMFLPHLYLAAPPETYVYVRIYAVYLILTPWPGPYFYVRILIVFHINFPPWPGPYLYLMIYMF